MIGMNSRSPSRSWARSCHGTRFAWCSISVSTIASPRPMLLAAPRVGDEVDRLGRVAGEDDLVAVGRVDEPADLRARRLVRRRSPARRSRRSRGGRSRRTRCSTPSSASMTALRLLARRRRVEEDERVAVRLGGEDREVARGSTSGSSLPSRIRPAELGRPAGSSMVGEAVTVIDSIARLAGGLHGCGGRPRRRLAEVRALRARAAPRPARRAPGRPRAGSGRSPRPRAGARGPCRRS